MIKDKPYQIIERDKINNKLSHAYLIISRDINLGNYLKKYAKIIMCENSCACNDCRSCRLIDKGILPDCVETIKDNILVDDINNITEQAHYKPIEKDKKLFLIADFASININSQNKLLKVLEEPPQNVIFLLATSSEHKVLPTIKSRVKQLELPPLPENQLIDELVKDFPDEQRLKVAVSLSGGYLEKAKEIYNGDNQASELALDILFNMKKSSQIPLYSKKLDKDNISTVVGIYKLIFSDITKYHTKSENKYMFFAQSEMDKLKNLASEYKLGASLETLERLNELEKNMFFYVNTNMIIDSLLFSLLEVKYKWQKL